MTRPRWRAGSILRSFAALGLLALGCAGPNLWTDLGSVSTGHSNRGRIRSPAKFPRSGKGFTTPTRWKDRNFRYGTDELVAAIEHAARRVNARDRRAKLGVADFSRKTGGPSAWHGSHHSGRDVDLVFYSTNEKGRPMPPPQLGMIKYDKDGKPFVGAKQKTPYKDADWETRRFDTKRNWQLVEELLSDPSVRVQWIFVSSDLKSRMLGHARRKNRPRWLIEYAATVMRQPGDAAPHDDHFHIRVYCTRTDRFHGCQDRGPVWQHEKKTFKYYGPERYDPVVWRLLLRPPTSLL